MVTENADAAAASQADPAPVSEEGADGAPGDGQTSEPLTLEQLAAQLDPEAKKALADTLLGKDFLKEYAAPLIETEAQRMADRRAVDNQLVIDKAKIDERYLLQIDAAAKALGEEIDQRSLDKFKGAVLEWQAEQRRAEFDYAVRRSPVFLKLSDEERSRIGSVREAPDADRVRVTLETMLMAQERLAREAMPAQVNKEVQKTIAATDVLGKLVQALGGAKQQVSSTNVVPAGSKPYRDMSEEERAKLSPQEIDAMTQRFLAGR